MHLGRQQSQHFTQVDTAAQFVDRPLAKVDGRWAGRLPKPSRQCVLTKPRACSAEKLKQRSLAEEIEVKFVGMLLVHVSLAAWLRVLPAMIQSVEIRFVVRNASTTAIE